MRSALQGSSGARVRSEMGQGRASCERSIGICFMSSPGIADTSGTRVARKNALSDLDFSVTIIRVPLY